MPRKLFLLVCSAYTLGLTGCFSSPQPTQQPIPGASSSASPGNGEPTPSAQPSGTASPDPTVSSTPEVPQPSSSPSASGPSFVLPDNVAAIRFANNDRFLDQQGENITWAVELVDRNGSVVPVENVPLEWSSSRPEDFSVDAQGKLTALVSAGYSVIEVRVQGTSLEARSVINVSAGGVGGGGGGGGSVNAAPVITSLTASETELTGTGSLVKLTASATDSDSTLNSSSFSWSCDQAIGDTFNVSNGDTVYWRTPDASGTYVITLTVSDGQRSVSQDVSIDVSTGQGTLVINPPPPS